MLRGVLLGDYTKGEGMKPKTIRVVGQNMGTVCWSDYHRDVLSWHGVRWYQDSQSIYVPLISDEMTSTQRLPLGF